MDHFLTVKADGKLDGVQVQPSELHRLVRKHGWKKEGEAFVMVCVILSESMGFTRARCDNISDTTGKILSRDCGIGQRNIPASLIGMPEEERLYDADYCLEQCFHELYKRRGFQPWVGYNTGAWKNAYYTTRSALGLMNYMLEEMTEVPTPIFTTNDLIKKKLW